MHLFHENEKHHLPGAGLQGHAFQEILSWCTLHCSKTHSPSFGCKITHPPTTMVHWFLIDSSLAKAKSESKVFPAKPRKVGWWHPQFRPWPKNHGWLWNHQCFVAKPTISLQISHRTSRKISPFLMLKSHLLAQIPPFSFVKSHGFVLQSLLMFPTIMDMG